MRWRTRVGRVTVESVELEKSSRMRRSASMKDPIFWKGESMEASRAVRWNKSDRLFGLGTYAFLGVLGLVDCSKSTQFRLRELLRKL